MNCCGPKEQGKSKEVKGERNSNNEDYDNKSKRSLWVWGVGIVLIVGLLAMLI